MRSLQRQEHRPQATRLIGEGPEADSKLKSWPGRCCTTGNILSGVSIGCNLAGRSDTTGRWYSTLLFPVDHGPLVFDLVTAVVVTVVMDSAVTAVSVMMSKQMAKPTAKMAYAVA